MTISFNKRLQAFVETNVPDPDMFPKNLTLAILVALYLMVGAVALLTTPKDALVWWFNERHQPFLDLFFIGLTFLGDGWFCVLAIIGLLFYRYYYALLMSLSFGLTSLLVSLLKHFVFSDYDRPLKVIGENAGLHLVEGIQVHLYNSFPSGHSATAFATFLLAIFFFPRPFWTIILFGLAVLASLSRPYLVQHFFIDTYFGAILGMTVSAGLWYFLEKTNLKNNPLLNRKILLSK